MKSKHKSRHHILPQSRYPHLKEDRENLVIVDVKKHQWYHALFDNKTPLEIVYFLNHYFWRNKYIITMEERR